MKSIYLLPILLLILLALVIWWFIRGANARRDELARGEAQQLRDEAAARHESTLAGQQAWAAQADERSDSARQEAEQAQAQADDAQRAADAAAEEARRAEEEAAAGHRQLEQTESAYAADLHRADVLDPETDVTEADPVPTFGTAAGASALGAGASAVAATHDAPGDDESRDSTDTPAQWGDGVMGDEPVTADVPTGDGSASPRAWSAPDEGRQLTVSEEVDAMVRDTTPPSLVTAERNLHGDADREDRGGSEVVDVFPSDDDQAPVDPADGDAEVVDVFDELDESAEPVADEPVNEDPAEEPVAEEPVTDEPVTEENWSDDAPLAVDNGSDGAAAGAEEAGDWQYDQAHDGEQSAHEHADHDVEASGWGRRISDLDEVTDGGFGVGSAAPIADGAQPLGHSVQAYRDTMTYRTEDAPGYDSCEPDVWFYDADSAQRAGFTPAQDG